jgi:hypothetical protein
MNEVERQKLLRQIIWDYSISSEEIEAVLTGEKESAGHFNREMIFLKLIESYSWFTVLQLLTPTEIKHLLTNKVISKLRSPALKKKYEFVQKRLQQTLPAAG